MEHVGVSMAPIPIGSPDMKVSKIDKIPRNDLERATAAPPAHLQWPAAVRSNSTTVKMQTGNSLIAMGIPGKMVPGFSCKIFVKFRRLPRMYWGTELRET